MIRPLLAPALAIVLFVSSQAVAPLTGHAGLASSASAPCASDLAALLARFDHAVARRDSAGLMALCRTDARTFADLEQRYGGWRALDTLACRSRLASVSCSGARAEAAVLRRLEWREYGRVQTSTGWVTMTFQRAGGAWAITSEQDRDYARARFTDLTVRLEPGAGTMRGTETLHVSFEIPGEDNLLLALNRGLDITAIQGTRGDTLEFDRVADAIVVPLPHAVHAGDSLTVRITFAGRLFNERAENHYSQVSIAPDGCFASWVTEWYARVQGPGSRSLGRIAFDLPAGLTVAAGGRPAGRTVSGDRERQVFDVEHPVDFSFAAARYLHRERLVDGITVGAYLLTGDSTKADRYLGACARSLRALREIYAMYPYDSYALVEIPSSATGSLGGSSEQGMNLFPTGVLPDSIVPLALLSHEIGHSWWGNLVKLPGAFEEALAQTSGALCLRDLEGEATMRHFLVYGQPELPSQSQSAYFRRFAAHPDQDRPLGRQLLGSEDAALLHDIADTKGFVVFDMLREQIGDSAFVHGMRSTVRAFGGKTAQREDLQRSWEKASGQPLQNFMHQWFDRTGAPELALRDTVVASGHGYRVRGTIAQLREPYDVRVEIVAVLPSGPHTTLVHAASRETPFEFAVSERPRWVLLDPHHKVLRWCDEFNPDGQMSRAVQLRGEGRDSEAMDTLTAALRRDPYEFAARYELARIHESAGRLEEALGAYGEVGRIYDAYPSYAPSVAWSALRLGEVCDRLGRRDSAKTAYRHVLGFPDEGGTHAEASRYLLAPYVRPAGEPGPDTLRTFVGTYASSALGTMTVSLVGTNRVRLTQGKSPGSALDWTGGTRFEIASRPGASVEFVDPIAGHSSAILVRLGNYTIRLERAK